MSSNAACLVGVSQGQFAIADRVTRGPEKQWQAARLAALARDNYHCQRCGASDRSQLDVHHQLPRSLRVDHSLTNLVTLCDGCHAALHLNLQVGLARRLIERWAVRLARWLDFQNELPKLDIDFGPVLRLLGKDRLRDGQLPVILAILQGKDVLAVRPTGSGKSLCFQIPVLLQPGAALVIEPLKALMKDQVRGLHDHQLPATFLSSDVPRPERQARLRLLEQEAWKFLYLAPERFDAAAIVDPSERERLLRFRPRHMVIDEAHTVALYGEGFRPAYAELAQIRNQLGRPQLLAFTATASPSTQRKICESLGSPQATVIVENPDRPNISLVRLPIGKDDPQRFKIIARELRTIDNGKAIVFVPTVREGLRVQAGLRAYGLPLEFFHSKGGDAAWRDQVQGRFLGRLEPTINAIVASSAFGMGIDIPDVRLVVHWQHPFSVEEYLQGFGRAGRDGRPARALLFTDHGDRGLLEYMVRDDPPQHRPDRIREIAIINAMATAFNRCFRRELIDHLLGKERSRKSLSMRIVEWVYAAKAPNLAAEACCDRCSPALTRTIWNGLA